MYSLGSVSAVGSWFCISVTSKVRKSLAEMVAEELVELLALLVPLAAGDAAALALGVAVFPVSACPAVI
jgi:alkylhydroperoxidase/carboxymuconolactone decarboxylase family protein YurZ